MVTLVGDCRLSFISQRAFHNLKSSDKRIDGLIEVKWGW
jgi:hypothetical protein